MKVRHVLKVAVRLKTSSCTRWEADWVQTREQILWTSALNRRKVRIEATWICIKLTKSLTRRSSHWLTKLRWTQKLYPLKSAKLDLKARSSNFQNCPHSINPRLFLRRTLLSPPNSTPSKLHRDRNNPKRQSSHIWCPQRVTYRKFSTRHPHRPPEIAYKNPIFRSNALIWHFRNKIWPRIKHRQTIHFNLHQNWVQVTISKHWRCKKKIEETRKPKRKRHWKSNSFQAGMETKKGAQSKPNMIEIRLKDRFPIRYSQKRVEPKNLSFPGKFPLK